VEDMTTKIDYKDLKKNDRIKSNQLGTPITGKLLESPKQGKGLKKVLLIWSNGEEIGMFNEAGSVYANQVIAVERDGQWFAITNYPGAIPDQDDMLAQLMANPSLINK
jgi:hypothetical protein